MKTRQGFVSNSSSSSYIIAVPRNFEITDDIAKKIFDIFDGSYFFDENEPETVEDIKNLLNKTINTICSGNGFFYCCDNYIPPLLRELVKVCEDSILISCISSGPDEGVYFNCLADKYKEKTISVFKKALSGL